MFVHLHRNCPTQTDRNKTKLCVENYCKVQFERPLVPYSLFSFSESTCFIAQSKAYSAESPLSNPFPHKCIKLVVCRQTVSKKKNTYVSKFLNTRFKSKKGQSSRKSQLLTESFPREGSTTRPATKNCVQFSVTINTPNSGWDSSALLLDTGLCGQRDKPPLANRQTQVCIHAT